ncbi:hypothetical protein [Streptomyces lavendulae]|uniref:hypothetical protein n=1 Tax=Streptomyces lavendulae TaxID=1914 RepID=UPI0036EE326C
MVIAVVGVIGSVLVARVSAPRPAPAAGPPVDGEDDRGAPALEVSPEIWVHMSGKISALEAKVDHLAQLVEQQSEHLTRLEQLLRQAMRLLRSAHKRLRSAGIEPDPVPSELIPYSID